MNDHGFVPDGEGSERSLGSTTWVSADEPQAEQHNGFFPWSMAKWLVPPSKAVRM